MARKVLRRATSVQSEQIMAQLKVKDDYSPNEDKPNLFSSQLARMLIREKQKFTNLEEMKSILVELLDDKFDTKVH